MTNTQPLLSVVIPTKNRYRTLLPLCEYLLEKEGDFEVIISDNSDSNDEFMSFSKGRSLEKINYVYSRELLSMRENCEVGLKLAKGEYIAMIGDDDGIIIDSALDCIHKMKSMELDFALSSDCKYLWPDLKTRLFRRKKFGILRFLHILKKDEFLDARKALEDVADRGGVTIGNMPRLYQGIVKASYIMQSIVDNGSIFLAPMPDMSSSTLLATKMSKGIRYKIPFIVNGVSSNSGGGLGAAGKHKGQLNQGYGLSEKDIEEWPDLVPNFWSGGTVWAASYLITLEKLGKAKMVEFNKSSLLAYCLVFQPNLTKEFERYDIKQFLTSNVFIGSLIHIWLRLKSLIKNCYFYFFNADDLNINNSYELL
ncbi:glycosyltransferase family 2 protein, partial [Salinivibrio kushneri]|uniref:glycosyltransferase family 2 protein n=1 Tax=Salinivibrio kushneri TaxID=1908198 RepID=UPI0009885719